LEWHRLEKGIKGCTISVILFTLAMILFALAMSEVKCRGPLTKSGVQQPPIRAFIDDLTVKTSVPGSRLILKELEKLVTWARTIFKPAKIPGAEEGEDGGQVQWRHSRHTDHIHHSATYS
jgi:hypothetical protein